MKFPKPYQLPLRPYGWIVVVFVVSIGGFTAVATRLPEVRREVAANLATQKRIKDALGEPLAVHVYSAWTKVSWGKDGKSGRFRCKVTGLRGSDYYSVEWKQPKDGDVIEINRIKTGPLVIFEKKD